MKRFCTLLGVLLGSYVSFGQAQTNEVRGYPEPPKPIYAAPAKGSDTPTGTFRTPLLISISDPLQCPQNTCDVLGLRLSLLDSRCNTLKGLDIGLINYVSYEMDGLGIGLFNCANTLKGLQIGGLNNATLLYGLQIGIINYSEQSSAGVQLGLINIIFDNDLPFLPILNFGF